ncbi:small heat shock protein [Pholiota conissans]|uniref:Small heat shock protein n=1 Tax=Pholiota conissans TaxID=109636 RepID=A0A9P5ZE79_9AGAR|nr:small heat shock protein [Pholiota conissans]
MDVRENTDTKLITATFEVPDVSKDDVKIEVHHGKITVSAETKHADDFDKSDRLAVRERQFESFTRTLVLPPGVTDDEIKAKMAGGVLTVTFPSKHTAKPEEPPRRISIS